MRRRGLAVTVGIVALCSSGIASASRGQIRDERGDAQAAWDILSITADNGPRTLRIKMNYRGRLRPHHTPLGLLANIGIDTGSPASSTYQADFTIDMLRGSTSDTPDRLVLNRRFKRVRCTGLRLRVQNQPGVLDFSLPQRCLGSKAGRIRVMDYTYSPRGAPDKADYVEEWSAWIPRS